MKGNHRFKPVSPQVNFPALEEETIKYWKTNKIFEKSIESRFDNKTWTFLDGPPFITGMPHYGTLLSSIPKDVFGRFWTMKGFKVRRLWGWDCHGLPAENKVENKLGLKRKKDIEDKVGVKKFIDECKLYVSEVSSEWEWYVDHIARWVDFKNAYKTMDLPYMETVMWVFKNLYDKGLIYKGLRVSLFCPHCSTPISNFEVAMDPDNYTNITEPADTYKYKLKGEINTYLLAWSTTPWNKLATPALAVNPKLEYVKVKQGNEFYILAKSTLKILKEEPHEEVEQFKGEKLIGRMFEPHYDFYPIEPGKKAFEIIAGDFVSAQEGTGIVTIAAYGEEDLAVMQKNNIQIVFHVDEEGRLKPEVPNWAGMYYLDVNEKVNTDLNNRGLLYKEEAYTHTVPTCWRCHTRLFYAPQNAWYVNVQSLKPLLEKTNEEVSWYPKHFKYGRYLNSLKAAPDWCISRSRYWGSPLPVWECENCGDRFVPGSIKELENWSGKKITDLHKPVIDDVTGPCLKCGGISKRVPEVLDSWIEAGSASFAERHFPFESELKLEKFFPPDFIVEYTGQIRAWFYVLHVITAGLFKSHAFKNVLVTGVILGTDGRKMSKNFGNYPDPREMLLKYGGDALRLYLLGSPVMHSEDIRISEEEYRHQIRSFLLTLWNVYSFFVTYINIEVEKPLSQNSTENILDKWIIAALNSLSVQVTQSLEQYDTVSAVELLKQFVEDLSTWYIRRSRDRVGPSASDEKDKNAFYYTCHEVLLTLCKLLAPISPFISEEIDRNLTGEESVHLSDWPKAPPINSQDEKILSEMSLIRKVVEIGHSLRKKSAVKVRQPLKNLVYTSGKREGFNPLDYIDLIKAELNVKWVSYNPDQHAPINTGSWVQVNEQGIGVSLQIDLDDQLRSEGQARDLIRQIQDARKELNTALDEMVITYLPDWPKEFEIYIKKQTLSSELRKSDVLKIVRLNK